MLKRIALIAVVALAWLAPTATANIRVTPRTVPATGGTVIVRLLADATRCILRNLPSGSKRREGQVSCHDPIRLAIKTNHEHHALTHRILVFIERHHRIQMKRLTIYQRRAAAPKRVPCTSWLICDPTPLPEGVLSLYSDGLLACSINVGGTVEGGECPVEYTSLGQHTVTTIYDSAEASPATETLQETIEPFPTTTTISASYEPLAVAEDPSFTNGCVLQYGQWSTTWTIGYLNVSAATTDAFGSLPAPLLSLGPESELSGPLLPVKASVVEECAEVKLPEGRGTYHGNVIVEELLPSEARVTARSDLDNGFAPSEASTTISLAPALVYPEGDERPYAEGDEP